MDVRRLDEMQAQGRSIFDTELAVAYYARVSTDKDEQINSLGNQKRYFEDYIAANPHWRFAGAGRKCTRHPRCGTRRGRRRY